MSLSMCTCVYDCINAFIHSKGHSSDRKRSSFHIKYMSPNHKGGNWPENLAFIPFIIILSENGKRVSDLKACFFLLWIEIHQESHCNCQNVTPLIFATLGTTADFHHICQSRLEISIPEVKGTIH